MMKDLKDMIKLDTGEVFGVSTKKTEAIADKFQKTYNECKDIEMFLDKLNLKKCGTKGVEGFLLGCFVGEVINKEKMRNITGAILEAIK